MSFRALVSRTCLTGAAALLWLCTPIAIQAIAQAEVVRVEIPDDPSAALPVLVAQAAGLYAAEKLDVTITRKRESGAAGGFGAMLRLKVVSLPEMIWSNRNGEDLRLVLMTTRNLSGVAASIIVIDERREELLRFARATLAGHRLALTDESQARAALVKHAGLNNTRAAQSYREFKKLAQPDLRFSATEVVSALKRAKLDLSASTYIDPVIIDELQTLDAAGAQPKSTGPP